MVDLYEQGQRDYRLVKPYMDEVLDLKSRIGKLEGLLKSAHEIISKFHDVTYPFDKFIDDKNKWLASYGKIKAE